jgi:predicted nucleic acid-binding Zn ribbon protein
VLNDKIESMRPLSSALPGALTELLRGTPLSPGKVAFAWRAAVGPALERETAVRLEGGTLIVDAATPQWASEVRRSSAIILRRMHSLLGPDTVKELQVRERQT